MKHIFTFFLFFLLLNTANASSLLEREFNSKAKPVFAKYCVGCHAASNAPDYSNFMTATLDRGVIYNRVFVVGDMPWRFRFSPSDQADLKSWLTMEVK